MIFITLGSQRFQFNRLLRAVDKLIEDGVIEDEVFAQKGYSDYDPINYNFKQFLDREDFTKTMDKADIVITHGGTGAIIGGVKKGKKVVAVPRREKYGEHVDDHQLQVVKQFVQMNLICECRDCDKLGEVLNFIKKTQLNSYSSNTDNILQSIEKYILGGK
ncbi:MAG: PssE/Cps14G family polysaccharide biosynthesis glycosyltransferase [Turicibacter sanguinis]|uniref:PssE/Cps14G family polysaccharide biosynthesis glycosyltransferase n=1 Tax=Turicibacter sanguinis TaxID=154288 RepID=UPI003996A0F3